MAKCWRCGRRVSGNKYTCSSCESLSELENLREAVESHGLNISEGLNELRNTISEGFSELASAIEWGFGELSWQLQQQTDVLRSIDYTLKTPGETKAKEWRLHAEELRRRGVLAESEEFFLKALNAYRLDYRIYVGLAETYLQMERFDKAKVFLERSLPHAPKKEIDYKSYSYRLIGHIHACDEDYSNAMAILRTSIELSPTYEDGHYDYAQYCAQTRNTETCLSSLRKAILAKPLYWYLAQKEQNFDPLRSEVEKLLSNIRTEAFVRAKDAVFRSERTLKDVNEAVTNALEKAEEAISKAKQALIVSRDKAELESRTIYENAKAACRLAYENAKSTLEKAKDKVASGDYVAFLEAEPIAEKSRDLAITARDICLKDSKGATGKALGEQLHYQRRRREKVKNAWKRAPGELIAWSLFCGFASLTVGYLFLEFFGCDKTGKPKGLLLISVRGLEQLLILLGANEATVTKLAGHIISYGFILLGIIIGFIFAIRNIRKKLR
ncbi:MAG: hypothetical protein Q8O04_12340 [Deltaproteobacteria bacterium]|nr:hypothetical protein [Deltaproteobacteria bacterium]